MSEKRPGATLQRRLLCYALAVTGLLTPAGLGAQEEPRCFLVSSADDRLSSSTRLQGEILRLTREPYSRGLREVVWWQGFLGTPTPGAEPVPWRELGSDSIEVRLGRFHLPAELILEDSGGTLRGYIRVHSDEVGSPPARYSFLAEETSCEEAE